MKVEKIKKITAKLPRHIETELATILRNFFSLRERGAGSAAQEREGAVLLRHHLLTLRVSPQPPVISQTRAVCRIERGLVHATSLFLELEQIQKASFFRVLVLLGRREGHRTTHFLRFGVFLFRGLFLLFCCFVGVFWQLHKVGGIDFRMSSNRVKVADLASKRLVTLVVTQVTFFSNYLSYLSYLILYSDNVLISFSSNLGGLLRGYKEKC